MDTKDKSCENCSNFMPHYVLIIDKFCKIDSGHCRKHKITNNYYKKSSFPKNCNDWEPKEKEIAKRKERLEKVLTDMAIKINDIIMLFKNGGLDI